MTKEDTQPVFNQKMDNSLKFFSILGVMANIVDSSVNRTFSAFSKILNTQRNNIR